MATTASCRRRRCVSSSARDEDAVLAELTVDAALVRALVASGAAAEIVGEQELKRRQHREQMVRYRRAKKSALEHMRGEEKALGKRLRSILRLRAINGPTTYLAALESEEEEKAARTPLTLSRLTEVLVAKEQLRQENLSLRRRWSELQYLEDVMRRVVATSSETPSDNETDSSHPPCVGANRGDGGSWKTFLEDEPPFYYVPFAEHECRAHVSKNADRVFGLQLKDVDDARRSAATSTSQDASGTNALVQEPTVVNFFDWRVHIRVEWTEALQLWMVRYKFRKTFRLPMRTLDETVDRMWESIHSPALFQTLHGAPVHLIILQSWNDNMSVALWNTPRPDRSRKGRATSLFSRTAYTNPQGEECVLLMMNGVDLKAPRAGFSEAHTTSDGEELEFTTHMNVYNVFKQGKEEGSIEIEHGGRVAVLDEAMGRYLMVELGCSLVRTENCILPMRVLQNGAAS